MIKYSSIIVVILALGIWVNSRWDAWFHNPEEPAYCPAMTPEFVHLTFGDEGELSRYVAWVCDTVVDGDAKLLLIADADTLSLPAIGEVYVSRSGKAAFYRAALNNLQPNYTYSYAVKCNNDTSSWYSFTTEEPSNNHFSFLFVGDVQDTIDGDFKQVARRTLNRFPDIEFMAFGGDFFERPIFDYYREAFGSLDSLCASMPIINITGNHDYLKYIIRQSERRFALSFPYYLKGQEERDDLNHLFSFHYHNTDFFLLDSEREFFYLWFQRNWFSNQLEKSAADNRIVLLHHPLFSAKKSSNNLIQKWMFNDLIQENNIDLVLQGHEHGYTRCTMSEEPLVGNLCSTPPLYTISHCSPKTYRWKPTERFSPVRMENRHVQIIRVDNDTLTMLAYDVDDNAVVDSVMIVKR